MNKKSVPWIIAAALVVVLITGGIWYYRSKTASAATSNFITGQARIGNVTKKVNATGTVQLPSQYNLSFPGKGLLTQVNVAVGDTVKAGQALAQIDQTSAKQQVVQAQAALTQAQLKVSQLEAGPSQVSVLQAKDSLDRAQAALASAQSSLLALESYQTQANLAAAIIKAGGQPGQSGNQLTSGQSASGQQSGSGGSPGLSTLQDYYLHPGDLTAAIQQATTTVSLAQNDYNLAQAQYSAATAGPSSSDLQSAGSQVTQAQANLTSAQAVLNNCTLTAPVDGIITAVSGQVGEYPQGSGAFIVLYGTSSNMQIDVSVDEADIGGVQVGQPAELTLAAYPDKTYAGKVIQVAPTGTTQNNVTTFDVTVSVPNQDNAMKSGMSANVSIIVARKQNVLVVPSEAVQDTGSQQIVLLPPADGSNRPQRQAVKIGIDDGTWAEVQQGLSEGDQVIIGYRDQASAQETKNRGFGGFGGMMGGGFYGGGGGAGAAKGAKGAKGGRGGN